MSTPISTKCFQIARHSILRAEECPSQFFGGYFQSLFGVEIVFHRVQIACVAPLGLGAHKYYHPPFHAADQINAPSHGSILKQFVLHVQPQKFEWNLQVHIRNTDMNKQKYQYKCKWKYKKKYIENIFLAHCKLIYVLLQQKLNLCLKLFLVLIF